MLKFLYRFKRVKYGFQYLRNSANVSSGLGVLILSIAVSVPTINKVRCDELNDLKQKTGAGEYFSSV